MGIISDIAGQIASSWKKHSPQLISSRESYNYLFGNGNKLTAQLQDLLRQCSYSDAITTGEWNGDTAKALSRFCNESGLPKNLSKQDYINHLIIDKEKKAADYMPAFVLIFSDPAGRLGMQREERAKIMEIVQPVAAAIQLIILDNPDKTVFINTLTEKGNRNRIELIYYSGNDDAGNFILNDGSFTITDFAPLLAYQENIKLMVSNTCNSDYFAETVTQLGIAGAMGSSGKIMDDVGSQYGQLFFKWIMEGNRVENFLDHFSRNRHSPVSEGDFSFFKAGWFPKDSVITWDKFVVKTDNSSPEIYSLVVGFTYDDASDSITQRNMQLMKAWLPALFKLKESKVVINTKTLLLNNLDMDKSFLDLFEKVGQSNQSEKVLIVYLTGKGLRLADYPVFCLPRLTTDVEYSSINIHAYFSTLSNSGMFNQVIVWYDLQEEGAARRDGLQPQFAYQASSKSSEGLLTGRISKPSSNLKSNSQIDQSTEGGLFTHKLLSGLNGKAADNRNIITANSISAYLKDTVPEVAVGSIGFNNFTIVPSVNHLLQKVVIHLTSDCIGKKIRLLDNALQLIEETTITDIRLEYELKPDLYTAEIPELSLQRAISVQPSAAAIEVNIGWRFLNQWICVIGSRYSLSNEKEATAQALGKFLADEGYGLITGGWQGIDTLVMKAYSEAIEKWDAEKDALRQIIAADRQVSFEKGLIEKVPSESWDNTVIDKSFAFISIGGKNFTDHLFKRARIAGLPFIPLPHTKGDSLKIYNELLTSADLLLPMPELKALGNYETVNEKGFFDTVKATLDGAAVKASTR